MAETENLYSLNIRDYFNSRDSRIDVLSGLISSYTCPKNPDIERFLKNSAIDFTRKQQSVTYLAFTKESIDFVGYFTLTVKPLVIGVKDIPSNTIRRKIERVARFDEETQAYSAAGYLIAQLGKNYTDGVNELVTGTELLRLAFNVIFDVQDMVGGMIAFLDAENNKSLIDFYERNGFHLISDPKSPREELIQFYRTV
ncbi:MAG: GNAT family acetyltransferase [Synergistaceae bacterium]|nr:GNAT family acetyltransferase [Synergistaceae bacterium]MBQ3347647.1 GNAT family acetyltransferase [Synergistaceae bacterium]MBQ6114813.1 GNAT family acetyltransferase [Synergistaceae bacterium]MBQ6664794.1 GNAT family acetyltransferase [Synergistaceae bacterium]MBQ6982225.1 GNAT family acetyltransferase [Synergistaceae bacterium]